eukprot:UN03698
MAIFGWLFYYRIIDCLGNHIWEINLWPENMFFIVFLFCYYLLQY